MKRSELKYSLSSVALLATLTFCPAVVGAQLDLNPSTKKAAVGLSTREQAFMNEYAQKVAALLKELFAIFDDYTNPQKGGSHSEYTDKAKAKVAEYKTLMDTVQEEMDNCADKNGQFYKILAKAHAIAQKRYDLLEQVCQVMEKYRGSNSNYQLGLALKPLKEQLSSAAANTQLRTELIDLKALMNSARIVNAAQLQAIIDELAKPQLPVDQMAQLNFLGTRLANG